MRWHQLNEDEQDIVSKKDLIDYVNTHCKEYISQNSVWIRNPLFRGMAMTSMKSIQIKQIRQDRVPKDSSAIIQTQTDEYLKSHGFKALRSNSMFCTGYRYNAEEYGTIFVVFPIGDFDYTWSPIVEDLTVYFNNSSAKPVKIINSDNNVIKVADMPSNVFDRLAYFAKEKGTTLPETMSPNFVKDIIGDHSIGSEVTYFLSRKNLLELDDFNFDQLRYQKNHLYKAIESKKEIMITGDKYLAIKYDMYYHLVRDNS